MPFGEELAGNEGLRTSGLGYDVNDRVRQHFTAKERDSETKLDYFSARYYASTQGRYISVDTAPPNLHNPMTLNGYLYCLNNPLHYIDPTGNYEEDVHKALTEVLAFAAGFSSDNAARIGAVDQGVDDNPNTSPFAGYDARRDYHFTTRRRRAALWTQFVDSADRRDLNGALGDLGTFLHAEQDSFSHEGYNPLFGHLFDGHAPDKTYNDWQKADRMAQDTFTRLLGAMESVELNRLGRREGPSISWDDIKPYVTQFNQARSLRQKYWILWNLRTFVLEQRLGVPRRSEHERTLLHETLHSS